MRKYSLTITRNFSDETEVEDTYPNLSLDRLKETLEEVALDTFVSSFVFVVSSTEVNQ